MINFICYLIFKKKLGLHGFFGFVYMECETQQRSGLQMQRER
jgi:hypothetical protein